MAGRNSWIAHGPTMDDLLWFQPQHRSRDIYSSGEDVDSATRMRRADLFFWECMGDEQYATEEVMYFIRMMGFGLVAKVGHMEYDHHLLTALAERWRPETHSFNLSIGEVSITLQDVEVLLGLRVDGAPVTGIEAYPPDIDGRNKIDLFTLRLLEDPEACGCFRWGSAVLAYTYRALCDSARSGEKNSLMCGLLVQSWTWTRISKVRPRYRRGPKLPVDSPLAAKRARPLSRTTITSHSLVGYRDQLSFLTPSKFDWTPYAELLVGLPNGCREGENIWMSRTYLHYFYVMEGHYPDRVMRQFGRLQHVPQAPLDQPSTESLHRTKRSSYAVDWESVHNWHVCHWVQCWTGSLIAGFA
ncbi:serine/threonine-protein phosphatase 7 long form homolog [Rutidosis leptorrhynchoides]|uniref:serine/threonine-protein phosphatase 7 long form homolog n=1 Tax=Rutidosis leptorrhynchoides TaxID=125765 RepID=UPI003A99291C